jgi:DNA-binding transcriptional ArsR family regulator
MSWQAVSYAVAVLDDDTELPAGARCVLLVIAEKANRVHGTTWPTAETIGRTCGMSAAQVRRHVAALVARGYIDVERRPGTSNRYRFPLMGSVDEAPEVVHTPRVHAHTEVVHTARTRAVVRAHTRGVPRAHARHTSQVPVQIPGCAASCVCEGTGFVQVAERTSAPCPNRRSA